MADLQRGRRGKLWIFPLILAVIVLAIFVGYNATYLKQDAQRDQSGNRVDPAKPNAPG
ncbi:MAG TPA: hypothetical protein VLG14_01115 [Sphingomonas sp.]|jgi:hypothetical protein|nr:hypothetical protein [Sphingomonas sp.]